MAIKTAMRPLYVSKARIVFLARVLVLISCATWLAAVGRAAEVEWPYAAMEASAKTYFLAPEGRGNADGSSETNAMGFAALQELVYDARQSTKVKFLQGVYPLAVTLIVRAPSSSTLFILEGSEGAVIRGNFDFATESGMASGIRLSSGNVVVRGLGFERTGFCVKTYKYATVDNVLIEKINAVDVHSCVVIDRDSTRPVTRVIVRDSNIKGYYRVGVRLAGNQSSDFLLDHLQIDGAHNQAKSDCFKGGIQLLAGVKRVHIRNSVIENNIGSCGENYQQGDGIEADHKEGVPDEIFIENVRVANSGDADFDMKANHVSLQNVHAMGGALTRYAYKMWTYDTYTCSHCMAFGSNVAYIHLYQAGMRFNDSTFANTKAVRICDLRHGPTPEERSSVQFDRGQVYVGNEEWVSECGEGVLSALKRLPQGPVVAPAPSMKLQSH